MNSAQSFVSDEPLVEFESPTPMRSDDAPLTPLEFVRLPTSQWPLRHFFSDECCVRSLPRHPCTMLSSVLPLYAGFSVYCTE